MRAWGQAAHKALAHKVLAYKALVHETLVFKVRPDHRTSPSVNEGLAGLCLLFYACGILHTL